VGALWLGVKVNKSAASIHWGDFIVKDNLFGMQVS